MLYRPEEWQRAGRGRSKRCDLSMDHVLASLALLESQATIKERWELIGIGSQQVPGKGRREYVPVLKCLPVRKLPAMLSDGMFHFYILNQGVLHLSGVDIRPGPQAWCGVNGLISLSFINDEPRGWNVIVGVINRIQHRTTGEIVEHVDQNKLFDKLIKAFAADPSELVLPTPVTVAKRGRRIAPGDVYAVLLNPDEPGPQYVFVHVLKLDTGRQGLGPFLRVFRHQASSTDVDLAAIDQRERFRTFFPLGAAQRAGLATYVGHLDVPAADQVWPVFKGFNHNPTTDKRLWFMRNRGERHVGIKLGFELPRDLLDAPWDGVVNHTLLVKHVRTGWTHRTDVRPGEVAAE